MGCRSMLEDDSGQFTPNSKRDEELEDIDVENNDEEDNYFEFEPQIKASCCNHLINIKLVVILLMMYSIKWGLT